MVPKRQSKEEHSMISTIRAFDEFGVVVKFGADDLQVDIHRPWLHILHARQSVELVPVLGVQLVHLLLDLHPDTVLLHPHGVAARATISPRKSDGDDGVLLEDELPRSDVPGGHEPPAHARHGGRGDGAAAPLVPGPVLPLALRAAVGHRVAASTPPQALDPGAGAAAHTHDTCGLTPQFRMSPVLVATHPLVTSLIVCHNFYLCKNQKR